MLRSSTTARARRVTANYVKHTLVLYTFRIARGNTLRRINFFSLKCHTFGNVTFLEQRERYDGSLYGKRIIVSMSCRNREYLQGIWNNQDGERERCNKVFRTNLLRMAISTAVKLNLIANETKPNRSNERTRWWSHCDVARNVITAFIIYKLFVFWIAFNCAARSSSKANDCKRKRKETKKERERIHLTILYYKIYFFDK